MDIANGILKKKPAGIQAYGNTVKTIEDDDGNQFNIGFTRPTKVNIDLVINFVSTSLQADEWKANLKNELIKAFNSLYTVGDSVYAYNLYYVLNNHSEIKNVTNFNDFVIVSPFLTIISFKLKNILNLAMQIVWQ